MASLQSHFFRNYMRLFRTIVSRLSPLTFRKLVATTDRFPMMARGVSLERIRVSGLKGEWLIPAKSEAPSEKTILYLHGGGWIMGWSNAHRYPISHLARTAHSRVFALDYRLAPEYPFPAPLDDCITAYRWLLEKGIEPQNIIVAGDSAGGNMTITLMLALKQAGIPLPQAVVCISPALDFERSAEEAPSRPVKDPVLTHQWLMLMLRSYLATNDPRNPLINPLYGDLSGLPPLLIQVGEQEMLLPEARRLAEEARVAGVQVEIEVWANLWHVWHLFAPFLPEAQQAFQKISTFIHSSGPG